MQEVTMIGEYAYKNEAGKKVAKIFTEKIKLNITTRGETMAQAQKAVASVIAKKEPHFSHLRVCNFHDEESIAFRASPPKRKPLSVTPLDKGYDPRTGKPHGWTPENEEINAGPQDAELEVPEDIPAPKNKRSKKN